MPSAQDWRTPPLSTTVDLAVASYRRGIAALVAGASPARASLQEAVTADPEFHLARVGLAAAAAADGERFTRPPDPPTLTRAERHHVEIVDALCRGDRVRAMDLRREHLLDYPADLLIVWAPLLTPDPSSSKET
jgi:DNA-binding GntR family transcriptional regulator